MASWVDPGTPASCGERRSRLMTPQGNGLDEIRKIAEQNRERIEAQNAELQVLKVQHQTIARSLEEKHAQNRKDIHGLRNQIQTTMDKFHATLLELGTTIHKMQLTSARAKGYWLGIGATVTFLLEIAKILIE